MKSRPALVNMLILALLAIGLAICLLPAAQAEGGELQLLISERPAYGPADGLQSISGAVNLTPLLNSTFMSDLVNCTVWQVGYQQICYGDCCSNLPGYTPGDWNSTVTVAFNNSFRVEVNITAYSQNASFTTSTNVTFVDDIAPIVRLNNPANNTLAKTANFSFMVRNQPHDNSSLSGCLLAIDNVSTPLQANFGNNFYQLQPADGKHNWSVACWDTLNNSESSANYTFILDSLPPVVTLHSPAQLDEFPINQSILFNFTAEDTASANISCRLNIGVLASSFMLESGSTVAVLRNLTPGTASWSVNCTDLGGNSFSSPIQTLSVVPFTLELANQAYSLADRVPITIGAPAGTAVNASVRRFDLVNNLWLESLYRLTAPLQFIFNSTEFSGNYTIKAMFNYRGASQVITRSIQVASTLRAAIQYDAQNAYSANQLSFSLAVNSSYPLAWVEWAIMDSRQTQVMNSSAVFPSAGLYTVSASLTDQYNNSVQAISLVEILNRASIRVFDNYTQSNISGASVSLGSMGAQTNLSGKAIFLARNGTYELVVKKDGYLEVYGNISLPSNSTPNITLVAIVQDTSPPIISILAPDNSTVLGTSIISLSFTATDNSDVSCSLLLSSDGIAWRYVNESQADASELQTRVTDDGGYQLRLECRDSAGNTVLSPIRHVLVDTSTAALDEQPANDSFDSALAEIDQTTAELEGYDPDTLSAADALNLGSRLGEQKQKVLAFRRDLNSLQFRKLSETELANEQDSIMKAFDELKMALVKGIEPLGGSKYVAYPASDELAAVLEQLNPKNLSSAAKARSLADNKELQSRVTISAEIRVINVKYYHRDDEILTVITKTITSPEANNSLLVEYIPSTVATIDELELIEPKPIVLSDSPAIILNITASKISYALRKEIDAAEIQKTSSFFIRRPAKESKLGSQITLFGIYNPSGSTPANKYLPLIIVAGLLAVILVKDSITIPRRKQPDDPLLSQLRALINRGELGAAAKLYSQLEAAFPAMKPLQRQMLFRQAAKLGQELNYRYVMEELGKALTAADASGGSPTVRLAAEEMQKLAMSLPDNYKQLVFPSLKELRAKLR